MKKSEQEIYDRIKQCAENYKAQLNTLKEKVTNVKGFCTIMAASPNLSPEMKNILITICKQL